MKTQSNSTVLQSLHVIWLALVGLLVYACFFGLIGFVGALLIARMAHAQSATPSPGDIDASFTGSWFDPAHPGQGLMLEVLPDNQLLALWFSYDMSGKQAWFGGAGTYAGNTARVEAAQPTGARWIPDFNPADVVARDWGSLTFTFSDHDHGQVSFDSPLGFGVGTMDLLRLTNIAAHEAQDAAIGQPGGVVADDAGNVYFSSSPNRIFRLAQDGTLTRIAGAGQAGYSGDGGPATEARFNFPLSYLELTQDPVDYSPLVGGLALDANHNLYVADAYNNRVRRIDANGIVTTVFGTGYRTNSGDGGRAAVASISWPQGIVVNEAGEIVISSAYGPLRKITPDGIANTMTPANCGAGYLGPGLCVPELIAIDAHDNIYAPDAYCRVRELRGDGSMITIAGADQTPSNGFAFTCGYAGDGQAATKAALSSPYAVAVAPNGALYIADTGNDCVRRISGGIITTFAGRCRQPGFSGDGGPATSALLHAPRGVAVAPDGSVYIADTDNRRLRRVAPNGTIATVAGNGADLAAHNGTIDASYTGNWYDPSQAGHGLMFEVLSDNRFLAFWFAFDPQGNQAWFGGLGTYADNTATIDAVIPTGGSWLLPTVAPTPVPQANAWGTLTFTFFNCRSGTVAFASGYDGFGSGSMALTRLTQPANLNCL